MNVLVTAIGSFAADIVIKNLKKSGFNVIGCDIYPKEWIVDSYQVKKFYQAPFANDSDEYLKFIYNICSAENIDFIIPLTDVEIDILNLHREWFCENHVLCISSKKTIELCRNKQKLAEFIIQNKLNIKTIPTTLFQDVLSVPDLFPVVCKPYDGRSSQGLHYVKNEKEWDAVWSKVDRSKYIVQPYIEGNIVTVDVVRQENINKVIAIARRELLRTPNGAGTSVYVFKNNELESKCIELTNALGIIGCANFEFIEDSQGDYHFIECNPRFSGGVEFSCMAGYDCVKNHMNCYQHKNIDDYTFQNNYFIARKYEEYITRTEEYKK